MGRFLETARLGARRSPGWAKELMRGLLYRRKRSAIRSFSDRVSRYTGGLEGKRVLEVGSDGGGYLVRQLKQRHLAETVVGINPALPASTPAPGCRLESADVREMPYAEASFDTIVSCSAFEHIHDLDQALAEMFRVLRPGGCLYSHFGPIWSAAFGHHLWMLHEGRTYTYWNTILPPFCHLLMAEQELERYCQERFGDGLGGRIAEYVLRSPEQSRMAFEDYERVFADSPFDVLLFKGYDDSEARALYEVEDMQPTLALLRDLHQGEAPAVYDGITVLLCKGQAADHSFPSGWQLMHAGLE
ncbi:MAG: class I SAM-dependent methyltransferase [Planctomycetota bacterium]